ncbi:chromatin assembly complex protein [Mycena belliarum]|uniref:Chromatin assembly complex protein n=1 Tax=Mycena belliarum TaxID=1033014 RepID=A0AAD6XP68_9AGAR|nr:chromatin assembly complex protein [Mycena belliae]
MRFRTLEIRWHDSKPISSCEFQPMPFKKARPASLAAQAYRLATAGEDNHVRVWMVHPNISQDPTQPPPRPARVEYLATLSRHSAAVNVVRWSPSGELIASAGDDGMVIIWAPSASPQASTYGSDLSAEDLQHEKEYWKPRTTFRCTTMQVYDLAWSPTGEFLLAGSTDNTARVFAAADGKCMHEIAEHSHYVQGVAWDPLNEYIATQSSDRSMHVYRISTSKVGLCSLYISFRTRTGLCLARLHLASNSLAPFHSLYLSAPIVPLPVSSALTPSAQGTFEAHAIGRNTRIPLTTRGRHSRTPSAAGERTPSVVGDRTPASSHHERTPSSHTHAHGHGHEERGRPRMLRSVSIASDDSALGGGMGGGGELLTPVSLSAAAVPATPVSLASTPASTSANTMFPPPPAAAGPSSRRSSFSGSNAPSSPSGFSAVSGSGFSRSAYGRSPSPMPALPAIRTPPERRHAHEYSQRSVRLYGDESFSNFFRRLAFSPDGALLLTPAGTFEDPSVVGGAWDVAGWDGGSGWEVRHAPATLGDGAEESAARGRRPRPVISTGAGADAGSASSVYIYSRANFARPPVAQLPGHKKASVAVRFSPVLFELRPGVTGASRSTEPRTGLGTATGDETERSRDAEESMEMDLVGPLAMLGRPSSNPAQIAAPAPQHLSSFDVLASPALSPIDRRPPTPVASKPPTPHRPTSHSSTPATPATGSVFALPYRMLYAVVTMDTVAIYDTQQAGPVCLLTKLHYDEFTDLTWSPDGQCLMLSSRDGYCTLVTFDEILPAYHTQQSALQLQQIAAHHSLPISYVPSGSTSTAANGGGGGARKRPHEPLTPAASVDGDHTPMPASTSTSMPASASNPSVVSLETEAATATGVEEGEHADGPPKKKRRVALTRVGDL